MRGRELSTVAVVTGEPVRYCIFNLSLIYVAWIVAGKHSSLSLSLSLQLLFYYPQGIMRELKKEVDRED